MKKMNTKTFFHWRKPTAASLLAACLTLFSIGSTYGQCPTITTLPWTEDFSSGALPSSCWTNTNAGNSTSTYTYWRFSGTPDYGTQNNGKTPGTFAWVDASSPYAGIHDVTLITPSIDVSSLTMPYLRFEWFKDNSDLSYGNNQLSVEVSSNGGTTWTSVFADTTNDPNWRWVGIPLASYTNSTIQIKFVVDKDLTGNGYFYDNLLLDNITVMESPTCFAPVNLAVSGITPTAATVTWNTPFVTPGNGYLYYYNTTGTPPTASTSATAATTDTFVDLTSLSPSTQYYFWARSVCSNTDTSEWIAMPLAFRTPQIPATLPYSEDYSGTTPGWSLIGDGQTNMWEIDNATGNTGNSMYISNDGGTSNAYATTSSSVSQAYRDIVLTAGTNPFNFSFDWKCAGEGTTWDYFRVWMVPITFEPIAGTQITTTTSGGVQLGGNFNDPSSGTSWFTENFIIPNTYAGDTIRLVFEWRNDGSSGSQPPAAIDNVNLEVITCATPNNLTASNITSATATLTWDAPAVAPGNGFEYYYNTTGVDPTATTTASGSATDTFANLTSLTPNTVYYAWVRSICSSTDTSNWSANATIFQTPCASSVTPWSYDVETASTTTSADIDDCWSTDPEGTTTSYRWNVDGSGSTPSLNTGPSGANSGSNYFYTEASSGSTGDTAFLRTPNVDISTLTLGALKFYYHMYGQTMGDLYVQVSTNGGTTWTTVDSIIGEQQTSENDPWLERMVLLNGYTGTISVRFAAVRGSDYYSDMSLDDISIEEAPTCLPPTIFSIEDIQTNSADIAWAVPLIVPGTGYEYYYNTTGNDPSAGTTASGSVTDTFANLTGLSQNTTYYVWVRSVCNSTDKSDWSAPAFVFTTLCTTADVPYVVPMATATPSATPPGLPDCMSEEALNPNDPEGWYATTGSPGSSNGFTGNYFQSDYTGSSDGDVDNWLYTNKVNMIPGVNYKISFKYGNNSSSFTEKLALAYGTAATADSMTTILFDDTSIQLAGSTDTNVYFTVPAAGTYYFGFHAHSDANEYYLFLSDISVDSLPTCHVANSLVANNITTNSADLAWFGTALKYRIEYGESGFTLGTGTQVSTNSGTYQLTGLDPNTTYDFYVKDVCVPGVDSADWSAVETFTTLCNVPSVNVGHDTSFCEGGQITLYTGNADTNSTVLWSTGATADSIVVNSYGEYYATITNEFDCSAADTVFVNVKPYPVVDLGTDTSICGNNTVVLDAGTQPLGTTFFWNTAATSQTITVADSGWYKVIADNVGCVTIDSVHVSKQEMPNVTGITGTSENADCTFDFVAINPEHVTDYYWDFGDGSNATGTTPTHTYSNNGSYDVTLIVSNECGTDSVVTAVNCSDLGIGQLDLNNEQLKLYPNPARDRITLQNESVYQMKTITVYNVLGQVIFNGKADATDRYTLNVQSYASGIYNVKITFKNGSWIQRKFEIRK